jgi:DNA-binding MarR family transcriptional regulator
MPKPRLQQRDYESLANFRYLLRRFLEFSEKEARKSGLAPRQHQALLAIKGFGGGKALSVGDLAEHLRIRHHSAVELADRLVQGGFVVRDQDPADHRRVLLRLTGKAERHLEDLSAVHLAELRRIGQLLEEAIKILRSPT